MSVPAHAIPFVGALFLLITALALNVSRIRGEVHVYLGDGGNKRLGRAVRAHGNALEHGLLLSVALVLAELSGLSTPWVVGLGWTAVVARLAHASGFLRLGGRVSVAGMVLTYAVELGLSWYLLSVVLR